MSEQNLTVSDRSNGNTLKWILASLLLIAIVVIIVLLSSGNDGSGSGSGEVVASVNGENITKDQLYEEMYIEVGNNMREQMINQLLVNQEAEKANVVVTDAEIDEQFEEQMNEIRQLFNTEEEFNDALAFQGMDQEALERDMVKAITLNLQLRKLLEPEIEITEEQISEYFEGYKNSLVDEGMIRASHILVESEELAQEILQQINDGADFAELAKEHSTDPGSGARGGDLDFFGRGQMVPSFDEAAFSLEEGEVSDIVQSDFGYHIIKVTENPNSWTLEGQKEDIQELLLENEIRNRSQTWVDQVKAGANVEKF